jgi:hypothetical protein
MTCQIRASHRSGNGSKLVTGNSTTAIRLACDSARPSTALPAFVHALGELRTFLHNDRAAVEADERTTEPIVSSAAGIPASLPAPGSLWNWTACGGTWPTRILEVGRLEASRVSGPTFNQGEVVVLFEHLLPRGQRSQQDYLTDAQWQYGRTQEAIYPPPDKPS